VRFAQCLSRGNRGFDEFRTHTSVSYTLYYTHNAVSTRITNSRRRFVHIYKYHKAYYVYNIRYYFTHTKHITTTFTDLPIIVHYCAADVECNIIILCNMYMYSRIRSQRQHTQYNTIIILSDVLYNSIGNAMLINNNYVINVIIMFIDCPGATTLFSTRAVCYVSCTARIRENKKQKSFSKAAADT